MWIGRYGVAPCRAQPPRETAAPLGAAALALANALIEAVGQTIDFGVVERAGLKRGFRDAVGEALDAFVVTALQTLGHGVKLVYFGTALAILGEGELSPYILVLAVLLAIVGTQSSRAVLDKMSDTQFRRWSRAIIMVLSVVYLGQGAYWLLQP